MQVNYKLSYASPIQKTFLINYGSWIILSYKNIALIYRDMNNSEMFEKYNLKYLEGKR